MEEMRLDRQTLNYVTYGIIERVGFWVLMKKQRELIKSVKTRK